MRRRYFAFLLSLLLCLPAASALAQDQGEWEISDDLKDKECPPGTRPDGKGFCVPVEPGDRAAPARAPAPVAAPEPPSAPAPSTREEEIVEDDQDGSTGADEEKKPKTFVKGELSNFIGSTKLVTTTNRVGVQLGWQVIDNVHYLNITPEVDLRFGRLTFGLGVPMALTMFDGNLQEGDDWKDGFDKAGDFRTEDWDEWSEYLRFVRYLKFGRKEDNIYFSLSQVGSSSLGHGALVRRYSVNIDPDSTRVAGQFDMYNDYAGFEIMTNSVVNWEMFGALAFVKPLSLFMDHYIARSLSFGFTYVADRAAPVDLETGDNEYQVAGGARPDMSRQAFLHGMGVDMEIKLVKTESVDIKPFVDYSWMMPEKTDLPNGEKAAGGGGFTVGVLGRFNTGEDPVHALRVIAEFRSFSSNYLPGYFDTFYEVQKYIVNQRYEHFAQDPESPPLPPTKFAEVFGRDDGGRHVGFYFEFNYSIVEKMSLTLALEGSDAAYGNHFLAHLEVPALSWLQFFASFHQRSMASLEHIFSADRSDKIVFTAARLRILPILFFNFRYYHTLMLRSGDADLDGDGLTDAYRLYEPHHGWMGDVEFGWEF